MGDLVLALHRGEVAGFRLVGPGALRDIRAALVACGIVDEHHEGNGVGEPVTVLAWVVREYYAGDAQAALLDLARLAGHRGTAGSRTDGRA